MLSLQTHLILLVSLISSAICTITTQQIYQDKSYAWVGFVADTGTTSNDLMRRNVLAAFQDMDTQATQLQAYDPNVRRPSTMAVLYVRGHGYIYHSSIRGAAGTSLATQGIMDNNCPHYYQGNCAEMGAIAVATQQYSWQLNGAYIAVYGVSSSNGQEGYLSPCSPNGCAQYVQNNQVVPLTKRTDSDVVDRNFLHVASGRTRSLLEAEKDR